MTADQSAALDNVVAAIEAFTDAKIKYATTRDGYDAPWSTSGPGGVDETREHMRDKLAELVR